MGAGIRRSCAAARGADIAAQCPYHAKHILWDKQLSVTAEGRPCRSCPSSMVRGRKGRVWDSLLAVRPRFLVPDRALWPEEDVHNVADVLLVGVAFGCFGRNFHERT